MSSSVTGRACGGGVAHGERGGERAAAVLGADGLGGVLEHAARERLELGLQRLDARQREAHGGALGVAADARELAPAGGRAGGLGEPDVLCEVGGAEHAALADDGHLAALFGREPVDVEQPLGAVLAEAQQAGDHVLLRGVHAAAALGVDAR